MEIAKLSDIALALTTSALAWFSANAGNVAFYVVAIAMQYPCISAGAQFRLGLMAAKPDFDLAELKRQKLLNKEISWALSLVSFGAVIFFNLNFGAMLIFAVIVGALGPIALNPAFEWFNRIWPGK